MSPVIAQFITAVVSRVRREDRGATAVEYGLLVGLIAVAIIITVGLLGGRLNALFQSVLTSLGGAVG
jgi:pilus assembly protein Flp/PilA